jgi:hypothetical protein
MKGDANTAEDARPYEVRTALVPVLRIPRAGHVARLAQRPAVAIPGLITVLALVGIGLLSGPRRQADDADADPDADPGEPGRGQRASNNV